MKCPTCGKAMLTERPHVHATPAAAATPGPRVAVTECVCCGRTILIETAPMCFLCTRYQAEAQARPAAASEGLRPFIESVAATSNDPHLAQEAERILHRPDGGHTDAPA